MTFLAAVVCFGVNVEEASGETAEKVKTSVVLAWNEAALQAVRSECTSAPVTSRNLAILHLALERAVREAPADERVSIITGGLVSSALFPSDSARFEALQQNLLKGDSEEGRQAAWTRARGIADAILEKREGDGSSKSVTYIPHAEPGQWRRTAPHFRPPELVNWATVRTFAISDPASYVPAGPPALDSEAWKKAADEIRQVGGRVSKDRTADQKASAVFWSDFNYTCTPPGHWNQIAADVARRRHFSEAETAHLFSLLNVAMADAGIVCWRAKYRYNSWRPVTALQSEGWMPLLVTPPHPEYPSGHSSFSGAAEAILVAFCGTDSCDFEVYSDTDRKSVRRFTSFSQAAREISESRIYGGIHFRFSCDDGLALGRSVAEAVLRQQQAESGRHTHSNAVTLR